MNWFVDFFAIVLLCSVQGSAVFLVFRLWERSRKTRGTIRMNYVILKWTILFYILPVSYIIDRTVWANGYLFQTVPAARYTCLCLAIVWTCGALYALIRYHHLRSTVRTILVLSSAGDEKMMECFRNVKNSLGIRRKIIVRKAETETSPFVCGIRKVYIMLPDEDYEDKALRIIFAHELTHVRQGDIVWKYLIHLVRCIHWFNPLIKTLLTRYDIWSEASCDIRAGLFLDGWKEYFAQIFHMSMKNEQKKQMFIAGLYEKESSLVERMMRVNEWGSKKGKRIAVSMLVAASVCAVSPMSALAAAHGYQAAYTGLQYQAEDGNHLADAGKGTDVSAASDITIPEAATIVDTTEDGVILYKAPADADDLQLETEEYLSESRASMVPFAWNLPKKWRKMTGRYSKTKGSKFTASVGNVGKGKVETGWLNNDNFKYYFYVQPGEAIEYTFTIPATDDYRFYVANWNTFAVTVTGYYMNG